MTFMLKYWMKYTDVYSYLKMPKTEKDGLTDG
jgi:hypothetical protein